MLAAPGSPVSHPTAGASFWSGAAWTFFGWTILAAIGAAVWSAALHPATTDPQAGPSAGVFTLVGQGGAWLIALICASLGTICGLAGLVSPEARTGSAWTAFALNAAVVAVSVVLWFILSP